MRQIPIFNHRQDETIVENDGEGDDNRDLSNDDDDGSENVVYKNEFAFFQT